MPRFNCAGLLCAVAELGLKMLIQTALFVKSLGVFRFLNNAAAYSNLVDGLHTFRVFPKIFKILSGSSWTRFHKCVKGLGGSKSSPI